MAPGQPEVDAAKSPSQQAVDTTIGQQEPAAAPLEVGRPSDAQQAVKPADQASGGSDISLPFPSMDVIKPVSPQPAQDAKIADDVPLSSPVPSDA